MLLLWGCSMMTSLARNLLQFSPQRLQNTTKGRVENFARSWLGLVRWEIPDTWQLLSDCGNQSLHSKHCKKKLSQVKTKSSESVIHLWHSICWWRVISVHLVSNGHNSSQLCLGLQWITWIFPREACQDHGDGSISRDGHWTRYLSVLSCYLDSSKQHCLCPLRFTRLYHP